MYSEHIHNLYFLLILKRMTSGAIMGGDRKREIWPCPYDMGQNFYF